MLLYIGLFLIIVGVLLFLLIMAINKFEIFAKIGFLVFASGTILGVIGVILNAIKWGEYMSIVVKCANETEEYKMGYEHGLNAGISNTLDFLEENGYINNSDVWALEKKIKKDNEIS